MKKMTVMALMLCALTLGGCREKKTRIAMLPYPETRMDDVVDDYHGTQVADPYRWLEDYNSAETAAWVRAQNEVTFNFLEQIPYREQMKQRLEELWNFPREGAPVRHGDWYYFFRNDGLQNQSVLYRQATLDGEPEVFLDPNKLSPDGTASLAATSFSKDGRYLGYSVSAAGSDWVEIHVMDTHTGEKLPDVIRWVKFSGAVWAADSQGFYYSAYDEPDEATRLSGQNRFQTVWYHRLGTPQSADVMIYRDERNPLRYFHGRESDDGRYIFISAAEGTHGTEILYRRTDAPAAPFRVLLPGFENNYSLIFAEGDTAYFYTNDGAPNYRVATIGLSAVRPVLHDFIPENPDALLRSAGFVGGNLMAHYLEHAQSAVLQYDRSGVLVRRVELPGIGTVSGFEGNKDVTETFYSLTSFTSPATIYRYDLNTGVSELFRRPEVDFDPTLYTSEQVFYTGRDGEQIPMFIVSRKGIKRDGRNPLMLYAYGGFNHTLTPAFNPTNIMFLEQGGIYVSANIRGGGEYGRRWHRSALLENRQTAFDDFITAAEYLIDNGYTSREKIAIMGGSNGGLLVGACMTQRPDLFAVAIPQVGVLDMLRYHLFTVGWGWAVEYGRADIPEQFEYLYAYSPLHNLREGVCYPATLITTADHDDRVVPAHSFKFAARLQAVQSCDRPTLIRIDTNTGHGAGKPTSKRIEEAADIYSFVLWNTGSKVSFGRRTRALQLPHDE
ncbi:MAG: prolyl oligopeptidase family serine peptidase [Rikenellaceae bacterium]|nr:prolyl oligopeptidase family serine peptidase [Rikenellaceae bacterium]MCL2693451.1 prolyl oligopeptidase family serine peptidase [Rikenellaceae bacterium]